MVVLAVLHAGALLFWLYLLSKSNSLAASAPPAAKKFKKFSVTYDYDQPVVQSPPMLISTQPQTAFGPSKRNRSVPGLAKLQSA